MARRLTIQRFGRLHMTKVKFTQRYNLNFDWGAYFVKKAPETAESYLSQCLESHPNDANVLHLRSVCKRKLARIDSALEDALEAAKFQKDSPGISLEICDGIYDQNQYENCALELYENTRKYRSAVVNDFKDRLTVVNENFQDCVGDSLGSFLCKNTKIFPVISRAMQSRKTVDKTPVWKIRKNKGECDVTSIQEEPEKLLSPLEIARRERWYRVFSQIYFGKNWVDEAFIRELLKKKKWQMPAFTTSAPYLKKLLKPECVIVHRFMRMLHARSPLYNEHIARFGNQKFFKKNREQYLFQKQMETRRKMFTILKKLREHRKSGKIEEISKYTEDVMCEVNLKTSRIMPWKFEFINEVYNTIALAHTDRYILPSNFAFEIDPFRTIQKLMEVPKTDQLSPIRFEFGDRSTFIAKNFVDPKFERQTNLVSHLRGRLHFAKYPIEKCYLLYEMGRTFLKNNRYDECNYMAKKAIEESKNCNSQIWAFLSMMLVVKSYVYLQKIEYCHNALMDALSLAKRLNNPEILPFVHLLLSMSEDIISRKKSLISVDFRRRMSKQSQSTISGLSSKILLDP